MTPLMSFWPQIYNLISRQVKLIEYRRNFPKDCKFAYMYVSKPVKAVCGIIYFGEKYLLSDLRKEYANDLIISSRIDEFSKKSRYAVEIKSFQKIQPISLNDLRENVLGFVAPQSYCLLDNNIDLAKYLKEKTTFVGEKIENDFSDAYPEHICKRY